MLANYMGLHFLQVLETARQVASSQVSSTPVPYDQMKSQCEALVTGKQQKMSILHSFKHQQDAKVFPSEGEKDTSILGVVSSFTLQLLINIFINISMN